MPSAARAPVIARLPSTRAMPGVAIVERADPRRRAAAGKSEVADEQAPAAPSAGTLMRSVSARIRPASALVSV